MSDFKTRLLAERDELDERISRLESFLLTKTFNDLHPIDRELLVDQRDAMAVYLRLLTQRADRLPPS